MLCVSPGLVYAGATRTAVFLHGVKVDCYRRIVYEVLKGTMTPICLNAQSHFGIPPVRRTISSAFLRSGRPSDGKFLSILRRPFHEGGAARKTDHRKRFLLPPLYCANQESPDWPQMTTQLFGPQALARMGIRFFPSKPRTDSPIDDRTG
jgi:hypothetical protein